MKTINKILTGAGIILVAGALTYGQYKVLKSELPKNVKFLASSVITGLFSGAAFAGTIEYLKHRKDEKFWKDPSNHDYNHIIEEGGNLY